MNISDMQPKLLSQRQQLHTLYSDVSAQKYLEYLVPLSLQSATEIFEVIFEYSQSLNDLMYVQTIACNRLKRGHLNVQNLFFSCLNY